MAVFIGLLLIGGVTYFYEEVLNHDMWVERRSINKLVRRSRKGLPNPYTGLVGESKANRKRYGGACRIPGRR